MPCLLWCWRGCPHAAIQKCTLACQVALVDGANKVFSEQKQNVLEEMFLTTVLFSYTKIKSNPAAMVFTLAC